MKQRFLLITFVSACVLLTSCGSKNSNETSAVLKNALITNQIAVEGGATTKEMIIRTNLLSESSPKEYSLVNSQLTTKTSSSSSYNLQQNDLILNAIAKAKEDNSREIYDQSGKNDLLKPENFIDLGVGVGTGLAAVYATPIGAVAVGSALHLGGSALKGFIENKRESEYEGAIKKLNDRRERDILLLSINEAKYAGDHFIDDVILGTDPKFIKEKIFQYQNEIMKKTTLSPKEMELFLKNSNDNFLLGLALTIKNRQDILNKDSALIVKSINKTNLLLEDMKKSMTSFASLQGQVLEEIRKQFTTSEQEIILNALFDKSNTNRHEIILSPENLDFFKAHQGKLATFKKFLKDDPEQLESLKNIVKMQERAQQAYSYLQVTTQIASNINLNADVAKALNDGASVASAVSSISLFMLTSNPLDALNAVSSLTSLFSKPKPDPRFSAIFENFKQMQHTLGRIQKQLELVERKLDNIDIGLKYVILQNQTILDLNQEKNNEPLYDCDKVSQDLKRRTENGGLNYLILKEEFEDSHQAESEKINRCLNYLSETFKDSLKYKKVYFSNQANPDNKSDDVDAKAYYFAINALSATYAKLLVFQDDLIKEKEIYSPRNLLSTNTIINNVRQLIANSFLFDVVTYNRQTHNWDIVSYSQIPLTIAANSKSDELLKDALKLVNVAIIQQGIIDGSTLNDRLLKAFWLTPDQKCEDIKYDSIACLANLNPTLAKNFISASFDKLVGEKYLRAWKKIAPNNPDWLNRKLGVNPIKVIWVGAGASPLFSGEITKSIAGLNDGAYIKIGASDELYSLPAAESLNAQSRIKSSRLQVLIEYKNALENELVERHLSKKLSKDELRFYNEQKIKQVIQ